MAPTAQCESESESAYVRLKIDPALSITLLDEGIQQASLGHEGVVREGDVTIDYLIEANHDKAAIGCEATDLYKAFVPSSEFIVPLDKAGGCQIEAELASPLLNDNNIAPFEMGASGEINSLPAYKTPKILFESGGTGRFTMVVHLRVKYRVDLAERTPVGNYGGYVKLYAMTVD